MVRQVVHDNSVASLAIRMHPPRLPRQRATVPLRPSQDTLNPFLELEEPYSTLAPPCRQNRALIDQVGQISACKPRRRSRNNAEIDTTIEWLARSVYLENGLTPGHVRRRHSNPPVKSAGPQ